MITQADLQFHTPADAPHDWAETYYFDIHVPEEGVRGFVYFVFRAGVGAVACDVQFWDTISTRPHDALYIDTQHHLPLPQRLDQFTLPNGVSLEAKSPTEYRVDYVGVDDTEIHLDYRGLSEPYDIHDPDIDPLAQRDEAARAQHSGFGAAYASHFDLTTRVTGHVIVRGRRMEVDAPVTMDHSWGPRPERGMSSMSWINANFDDLQLHGIFAFAPGAPGTEHTFAHGYAIDGGTLHGGVSGTVRAERDGLFGTTYELSVTGADGTERRATGRPVTNHLWYAYGCCPTAVAMIEWRTDDGRVGHGTTMETFPLDTLTGGGLEAALSASV